ncbi:MAG: methyl-accepting chemotaxis protein [Planctomycetota bacterium]
MNAFLLSGNAADRDAAIEARSRLDKFLTSIGNVSLPKDMDLNAKLKVFLEKAGALSVAGGKLLESAVRSEGAASSPAGSPDYAGFRSAYKELSGTMGGEAIQLAVQNAVAARREATSRKLSWWILGLASVTVLGVVYAVWVAWFLSRTICSPLEMLTQATRRMAGGDLTVTIPTPRGNDEVAQLARSFQEMLVSQREIVGQLKTVANQVAEAAHNITDATAQQSATGSQQASAVAETTATVDEVNQTFARTSTMIQSVTDLSSKAVEVSHAGLNAVEDNVRGMREAKDKMESIAENILALSEKTQLIGEIISSVNDISEQSKFLALNASIEAARAGEHGKGFAVVAMEVRNLAEQSKQATTQVRDILIDIQNATNSSVMVTEEGSRRVDAGVELANQTGAAIRELAQAVAESSQAAEQIATSVREQTFGMSQITTAMNQINQAAAHNLAGTKQVELAAKNLRGEGMRLKEAVNRYSV